VIPPSPPSLLVFALLHGAPAPQQSSTAACEDLQRIELELAPLTTAREICVSPGLMTSFVFDVRAEVELQDEVRFQEVARGRGTISFLPPRDMMPGERLRLMARLGAGETQDLVTFTLVARSGQATHQVEVYHAQRSRESYQHEVAQEQAKVHQLREQLEQMRTRLAQSEGLRALITSKELTHRGIQARSLATGDLSGPSEGTLSFQSGASYRTNFGVVAELRLINSGSEPRNVVHASLVDATGKALHGMKPWQERPLEPGATGLVIVELDAQRQAAQGEFTLVLKDDGGHVLHLAGVSFPD
jgi:uncharacterized protein (TIGR02268 family)